MVSNHSVAFHEGFAHVFGNYMYRQLLLERGVSYDDLRGTFEEPMFMRNKPETFHYCNSYNSSDGQVGEVKPFSYGECEHQGDGTFDCCSHGWISLLSGLNIGSFNDNLTVRADEGDIVYYDFGSTQFLNPRMITTYDLDSQENLIDETVDTSSILETCHIQRPKISFMDLLQVIDEKPSLGIEFIDSPDMKIDGFISRLLDFNFADLSEENLELYKQSWDIGTTAYGDNRPMNYYCKPSLLLSNIEVETDSTNFKYFSYNNNMNQFEGNLIVEAETFGNFPIEDIALIENPSSQMGVQIYNQNDMNIDYAYSLLNDFQNTSEREEQISRFKTKRGKSYQVNIDAAPNGSFPLTKLTWKSKVGCPSDYQNISTMQNLESMWAYRDCELNGDDSVNLFENQKYSDEWLVNEKTVVLGADYKAKILAFVEDDLIMTSTELDQIDLDTKFFRPFISNANAREARFNDIRRENQKPQWREQGTLGRQGERNDQDSNGSTSPVLDKKLHGQTKYFISCGAKNIGNVDPNISSKVSLYTFKGKEPSNNLADWTLISESSLSSIKPGDVGMGAISRVSVTMTPSTIFGQILATPLTRNDPPIRFIGSPHMGKMCS